MSNLVEWLERWYKPFLHLRARVRIPSVVPPSPAQWIQSNWMQSNSTTTKEAIRLQVCWSIELLALPYHCQLCIIICSRSPCPGLQGTVNKAQVGLGKDWIKFLPSILRIYKKKHFSIRCLAKIERSIFIRLHILDCDEMTVS